MASHNTNDPYQMQHPDGREPTRPAYGNGLASHPGSHLDPPYRPPLRTRIFKYFFSFTRQLSLAIPVAIFILDAWWFGTGRVCDSAVSADDDCYWALWTTLPIAAVAFIWHLLGLINTRRQRHHQRGIPVSVRLGGQGLVAAGATVCFALLIYHYINYYVAQTGFEGGMIALLVILALIDWTFFGSMIYEATSA